MFNKILPITTIGFFIGLSTASYSAGNLLCHESLDYESGSSSLLKKKRDREKQVHDPLELEKFADQAQDFVIPEGGEFLNEAEQDKIAEEPETKKLARRKSVSLEPQKRVTEFKNNLEEDGEGWVQYSTPLTEESRKEVSLDLDAPMAKAIPFPKSRLGNAKGILGEQRIPNRLNIEDRRERFLKVMQESTENRRNVQFEYREFLKKPESTPLGYWIAQYTQGHADAEATLEKFNEYLPLYQELVDSANKINAQYQENPNRTNLAERYANISNQLLWYEQKLLAMAEAYGKVQRSILAAIDESKSPENPIGLEKELRPVYIYYLKNAIYCSFRLPSISNKEIFNSISTTFLGNLQTFIIESLRLDDNREKYEGLKKASGYLNQFDEFFMNNMNSFHTLELLSVEHDHGDFGPCRPCAAVCADCLVLLGNLEEKKELVSRLLREHSPQTFQPIAPEDQPTPMDIDKE
ncbi:MAG: hypothetical protein K2Y18_07980 [Alphaproteobacteria bacterium]|jgi:hypothetical protein|nr:hypothetical protein [Alphaproteobacteria bacterium]